MSLQGCSDLDKIHASAPTLQTLAAFPYPVAALEFRERCERIRRKGASDVQGVRGYFCCFVVLF